MLSLVLAAVLAPPAPATPPPFVPARLTRTAVQRYAAPPPAVFPLLGPAGETRWAGDDWKPAFLWPRDARDERGAVFTTGKTGRETIWLLTVYDDKALRIAYVQVSPGHHVAELEVRLQGEGSGTRADVTYTWTGLSEAGNAFVDAHRGSHFDDAMAGWERELQEYLAHAGAPASRHP